MSRSTQVIWRASPSMYKGCTYCTILASVALATLTPLFLVYGFGADWGALGVGASTWVVAFGVKVILRRPIQRVRSVVEKKIVCAVVLGIFSALCELGTLAFYIMQFLPRLTSAEIIGMGSGAGSMEIYTLFGLSVLKRNPPNKEKRRRWSLSAQRSLLVRYMVLVERCAALFLHIGSRALLYFGIQNAYIGPIVIAFLSFGAVDGVASYGKLAKWDWFRPNVAILYYSFVFAVGIFDVCLFAMLQASH